MSADRYSMSFTTGCLLHQESVRLAALFLELGDWRAVRRKALADNLLQTRTLTWSGRLYRETAARLHTLDDDELRYLVGADYREQALLLWIAMCRRFRFIADFAVEVVRERMLGLQRTLAREDFDAFFNRKSATHPELDDIRRATRDKLRQVLFKTMREAGLLTARNEIVAPLIAPELLKLLGRGKRRDLLCFPVFESSLKGVA